MRATTMGKLTAAALFAALVLAPRPAVAQQASEPATGFLIQGQIAANLGVMPGYGPNYSIMPALRFGGQLQRLAVAGELNYNSFSWSPSGGNDSGAHLIAPGFVIQPVVWRGANRLARLCVDLGFNVGAVVIDSGSRSDTSVTGGFHVGLLGQYFLHRNFGLGVAGGIRAQFIHPNSTLVAVAAAYVALSLSFVAGS